MFKVLTILLNFSFYGSLCWANDTDPDFDYGPAESQFKWGAELPLVSEKSDFKLRIGTRIQAFMESKDSRTASGGRSPQDQDFYVRRVRFQAKAKFQKNMSYYMDIRADKVDKGNSGGETFALGDAFLQVKKVFGSESLKLRLFRAKYDVSRSQTVSSSRLLIPNRASISDYSSEYISKARRGTNIQLLGNWSNRVTTQFVIGDSINESSFQDALGNKSATLNNQSFAYGMRVRVSPFSGWEEERLSETQFGQGQHLTLGAGAFFVNNINFTSVGQTEEIDRSLYNFDLSFHVGAFSFTSEYFIFDGVVEDFATAPFVIGKSKGWLAQFEYVLTNFHYISPFFRYQSWDRFETNTDFEQKSWLAGINYYLKGNKLRIGAYVENTDYSQGLTTTGKFADSDSLIHMNLMMHY